VTETLQPEEVDRKARRRRLTARLEALRDRVNLIELELQHYTNDFFRVCIFGSARIKPDDKIYQDAEKLAYLLAKQGVDVLTGGGPGLMEAANKGARRGAQEVGGKAKSFGISIELNKFETPSEHLDIKHHHRRFSSRLDDFMRLSNAVIVTPGGIGTILELYFSWQLLQVGHMAERPIILLGREFWSGLIDWMQALPVNKGLVSAGDLRWIHMVDTPDEVLPIVDGEIQKFKDRMIAQGKPQFVPTTED
jgi:uncharacterized protein (TIGR00730 family)